MTDREVEKLLKKSVKKIKPKKFSEVWAEIGGEIAPYEKPVNKVRNIWKIVLPVVAACLLVITIPVGIFINQSREKTYLDEELNLQIVQESYFYEQLSAAKINHIDFRKYDVTSCFLYVLDDNTTVKGGEAEFSGNILNSYCIFYVRFYDKNVKVNEGTEIDYDKSYQTNGAEIEYTLSSSQGGINVYNIKASFRKVNYLIRLTCMDENIEPILQEFFK